LTGMSSGPGGFFSQLPAKTSERHDHTRLPSLFKTGHRSRAAGSPRRSGLRQIPSLLGERKRAGRIILFPLRFASQNIVNFLPMHTHIAGSIDSETDFIASNINDRDDDIIGNNNRFVFSAGQNKHEYTPMGGSVVVVWAETKIPRRGSEKSPGSELFDLIQRSKTLSKIQKTVSPSDQFCWASPGNWRNRVETVF